MNRKNKGFTIIELMVAVTVIALISSMVFANVRRGSKQYEIELVAQEFASTVRLAQHLALSSHERGGQVPCGYGIYCDSATTYVIFYNLNNTNCTGYTTNPANTKIYKRFSTLPAQFAAGIVGSHVFFTPPYPTVYINGLAGEGQSANFTFNLESFVENVIVRGTGNVEKQ